MPVFVMNVSDFESFFVARVVFIIIMNFIFLIFSFDLRSADLAAQLLRISRDLEDTFAALS